MPGPHQQVHASKAIPLPRLGVAKVPVKLRSSFRSIEQGAESPQQLDKGWTVAAWDIQVLAGDEPEVHENGNDTHETSRESYGSRDEAHNNGKEAQKSGNAATDSSSKASGGEDQAEAAPPAHKNAADAEIQQSGHPVKANKHSKRLIVRAGSHDGDEAALKESISSDTGLADLLTSLQDHHWRIKTAEVEICTKKDGSDWLLGSGSFGKVYKGILNASLSVAIKSINDDSIKAKVAFIEEIVCLMNLRHANVVQFFGAVIDNRHLLLITEFMPRGSLFECISRDRDGNLKWFKRGHVLALDIVRGLLFMHARDCLHRDLKSMNVLLGKEWQAKICDVGMCSMPAVTTSSGDGLGTLYWTAPEVLEKGASAYRKASDVFSLGVILWEVCSGQQPEHRQFPLESPEDCPEAIADLIRGCLSEMPQERPTMQTVFNTLVHSVAPPTRPLDNPSSCRRLDS
ncbi:hypothetical protein WJX74_000255 [Apatococcus lobatus]|uniref:Protein kinase domain-containing protein n=1 Tax=Apatococcus lobatus TaxID=904363 RepID=A0AAW1QHV4_9CHLO